MKTQLLKKLSAEFSDFLAYSATPENTEEEVQSFWSARYGVNNSNKEAELLNYYLNN